ncbi:sensor histidine kinase [Rosettibacter firmus]|uniref:sensor histidine kinase n=1 Tax=Rosettibacter firmus TaxID=3111522 RepID=UPI00336BC597
MRRKHIIEEEKLKNQQTELMALFAELAPDPIFRFDNKGKIILANNSAHKIIPHRMLLGEQVDTVLPFIKEFDIEDIIQNGKTITYTDSLAGNPFQFLIAGIPKLNVCQVYGRDISELKKTERELKIALEKADESRKLKEYFLSQISHEIRSPLNVIIGYADLFANEKDITEEKKHAYLAMINNSKRLYRTFDLLINMSQVQTHQYQPRFEQIDLNAVLKAVYKEFESHAEEKDIKLIVNSKNNDAIVIADHYSISQSLIQLVDNAIKYTEHGKVEITLDKRENNFIIEVADTGIGISEEYLKKLFTPFTQANMSYTRLYEGTGLGLTLVKHFLDLNKAEIKVKSEPGRGSVFTIILKGDMKWKS